MRVNAPPLPLCDAQNKAGPPPHALEQRRYELPRHRMLA